MAFNAFLQVESCLTFDIYKTDPHNEVLHPCLVKLGLHLITYFLLAFLFPDVLLPYNLLRIIFLNFHLQSFEFSSFYLSQNILSSHILKHYDIIYCKSVIIFLALLQIYEILESFLIFFFFIT